MTDDLHALEESLWRPETRFDDAHMDRVLTADFREVGRSGRSYDRTTILEVGGPGQPIGVRLPLADFRVSLLSPTVALVTYVSEVVDGGLQRSHRASVWIRDAGQWRLRFHQGTPTSADVSPPAES